jgi:cytochrome c biogenesis protein CcmG/thiol:disulfide interchange protein DsbE
LPDKGLIPSPLIGKPAPQFSLPSLYTGAGPVDSARLRGHWSVVNVWGSWCDTCRAEHPTLLAIEQQQQGRVPIIGIDWHDDDADAMSWLGQLGNPYMQVGADRNGQVAIAWGVYGAPESFLVDPRGIVVYKQIGEITPEVWQKEFLARINAAGPVGGPADGPVHGTRRGAGGG